MVTKSSAKIPEEIPQGLRDLFEAAGPVIRHRLVRDVVGRDESYISTAQSALDLRRLPEVESLVNAQELDGSWSGCLAFPEGVRSGAPLPFSSCIETAVLRLCELGLERCDAVEACIEKALLPTLLNQDIIWELESQVKTPAERRRARTIVRDVILHLICRATREHDELLHPFFESLLEEWRFFLEHAGHKHGDDAPIFPPTRSAYAAVCIYPWTEDGFLRVRDLVARLSKHAESVLDQPRPQQPAWMACDYRLHDKWEYLANPTLLFQELESASRLGVARDLSVTAWLLEELEARQDADGWMRFDNTELPDPTWYFPLENNDPAHHAVEWTFRAELIFKLIEYDL